jgi:hypothetical protein
MAAFQNTALYFFVNWWYLSKLYHRGGEVITANHAKRDQPYSVLLISLLCLCAGLLVIEEVETETERVINFAHLFRTDGSTFA